MYVELEGELLRVAGVRVGGAGADAVRNVAYSVSPQPSAVLDEGGTTDANAGADSIEGELRRVLLDFAVPEARTAVDVLPA